MTGLILLDYANYRLRSKAPTEIFTALVDRLLAKGLVQPGDRISSRVRIYGGWFNGMNHSPDRSTAMADIIEWPAIISHAEVYLTTSFEFADDLFTAAAIPSNPRVNIRDTVQEKKYPPRFRRGAKLKHCHIPTCAGPALLEWFKSGTGCNEPACPNTFMECFQPQEQKQVDVHIAIDLTRATREAAHNFVAVVSDDVDFAPAVAGALSDRIEKCEIFWMRVSPSPTYLDKTLSDLGAHLVTGF